jgi:hypothetical protein
MVVAAALASSGCIFSPKPDNKITPPTPLPPNDTPANAIERFRLAYEQKLATEYQGMFTGDFTYEFSNATDPKLVSDYSTGWFKNDEKESSAHLFAGYSPPGGVTLEPASTISIKLAVNIPTDDNTSGVDPTTHKYLATRVDGQIVVPNPGTDATTYVIENNFNVFYVVRGDQAVNLDTTQPADSVHWYIYRWVDLTGTSPAPSLRTQSTARTASTSQPALLPKSWGGLKGAWR